MAAWLRTGLPSAGLYAGPTAWLISTQANYALVPWMCAHKVPVVPLLAAALVVISLLGGFLSWRALSASPASSPDATGGGRPHRFIAAISIMMAVLFALVIAVHAAAGMVFSGCER